VVDSLARYIQRRHPNLRGFTRRNLFRMRQYFEVYKEQEKVLALLTQLPWTHHLMILSRSKRAEERELMVIVRENENGGSFYAPLSLNIKLTFTPVGGGAPLEAVKSIRFPAKPLSVWTDIPGKRASFDSFVNIDSDADGVLDLMLPGTSNFAAGFKGTPSGGHGPATKTAYAGVPYCDGSGV